MVFGRISKSGENSELCEKIIMPELSSHHLAQYAPRDLQLFSLAVQAILLTCGEKKRGMQERLRAHMARITDELVRAGRLPSDIKREGTGKGRGIGITLAQIGKILRTEYQPNFLQLQIMVEAMQRMRAEADCPRLQPPEIDALYRLAGYPTPEDVDAARAFVHTLIQETEDAFPGLLVYLPERSRPTLLMEEPEVDR
jgi:hypothetical protein